MECLGGNHIKFDFLGKDSIRYENEVAVKARVYALVKEFCARKEDGNREFPHGPLLPSVSVVSHVYGPGSALRAHPLTRSAERGVR